MFDLENIESDALFMFIFIKCKVVLMFRVVGEPQLIKVQTSAKNIIPSGVTTKCTNSTNQNAKQRNKNTHNTNSEVLMIFEHVVADSYV